MNKIIILALVMCSNLQSFEVDDFGGSSHEWSNEKPDWNEGLKSHEWGGSGDWGNQLTMLALGSDDNGTNHVDDHPDCS